MIEITTYNAAGREVDTAEAETEADATFAARTLLEDAVEAGHRMRDLTVVFKLPGAPAVVLGRDVAVAA